MVAATGMVMAMAQCAMRVHTHHFKDRRLRTSIQRSSSVYELITPSMRNTTPKDTSRTRRHTECTTAGKHRDVTIFYSLPRDVPVNVAPTLLTPKHCSDDRQQRR
jgi:hypothetical protein